MALDIQTFSNRSGGQSLFKALGHPLTAPRLRALLAGLAGEERLLVYDPLGHLETLAALYDLGRLPVRAVYVQDGERVGRRILERDTLPVTALAAATASCVLVTAFDAERLVEPVRHLLPAGSRVVTLDEVRLPDAMLTNPRSYLDARNFATNFAFFRDAQGHHTRLITANYWAGYGASGSALWLSLFDAEGEVLAQWEEALPAEVGSIVLDSRSIRQRFGLGEFTGSLFLHALRIAGHDVVKYALDTFGDDAGSVLSCTHDANAWPADRYAGLPAPAADERVVLWVQNSHPCPIPRGGVGLNAMGSEEVRWLDREIPPFGTCALDVAVLQPAVHWPAQLEVRAGKHFVRPRYEIYAGSGRQRIAHANVERTDLAPDPEIPRLAPLFGKGYLLPAPVLPPTRWRSLVQPTPMATDQHELPVQLVVYDAQGHEQARHRFGALPRAARTAVDAVELLAAADGALADGYGHMELMYDLEAGQEVDGWLHALFRYEDRASGHSAETSFGAHIFNTALVYKSEPQSYAGRPPGLSTRLFLRLGHPGTDTLCHLIYPASMPWHAHSSTALVLHDDAGHEVARRSVAIPCSGSLLWRYAETFTAEERARADGGYVLIRDLTCRLFGYHGLLAEGGAFSLDHMFGF